MADPNESIAVWDLAPDNGGPPGTFQALRWYAAALVEGQPKRYRLAQAGDIAPTQRSDGKSIDWSVVEK